MTYASGGSRILPWGELYAGWGEVSDYISGETTFDASMTQYFPSDSLKVKKRLQFSVSENTLVNWRLQFLKPLLKVIIIKSN